MTPIRPEPHASVPRFVLRLCADRAGVAAVEFAITGMLLFLLMFGIVNMGDLAWCYTTLHQGTIAAARYASLTTNEALANPASGTSVTTACAGKSAILQVFAATVVPPLPQGSSALASVTWSGTLAACNTDDTIGNAAMAAFPTGAVTVAAQYTWTPLAMPGSFGAVTITASDSEPVLKAPQS